MKKEHFYTSTAVYNAMVQSYYHIIIVGTDEAQHRRPEKQFIAFLLR